jgi:hypothetical protein
MSNTSDHEREQRALDALIVSNLRYRDSEDLASRDLPPLRDETRRLFEALGDDFVEKLIAGKKPITVLAKPRESADLVCAGEDRFGMYRADQVDQATNDEIDRQRKEALERIARENNEQPK